MSENRERIKVQLIRQAARPEVASKSSLRDFQTQTVAALHEKKKNQCEAEQFDFLTAYKTGDETNLGTACY